MRNLSLSQCTVGLTCIYLLLGIKPIAVVGSSVSYKICRLLWSALSTEGVTVVVYVSVCFDDCSGKSTESKYAMLTHVHWCVLIATWYVSLFYSAGPYTLLVHVLLPGPLLPRSAASGHLEIRVR